MHHTHPTNHTSVTQGSFVHKQWFHPNCSNSTKNTKYDQVQHETPIYNRRVFSTIAVPGVGRVRSYLQYMAFRSDLWFLISHTSWNYKQGEGGIWYEVPPWCFDLWFLSLLMETGIQVLKIYFYIESKMILSELLPPKTKLCCIMWTTLSVKAKYMSFGLVLLTTEIDIVSATNQQILRIEESLILLSKYLQF